MLWKNYFYQEIIKEATENGDPVASRIKQLKFEVNSIVLLLTDPYKHLGKLGFISIDISVFIAFLVNRGRYFLVDLKDILGIFRR